MIQIFIGLLFLVVFFLCLFGAGWIVSKITQREESFFDKILNGAIVLVSIISIIILGYVLHDMGGVILRML